MTQNNTISIYKTILEKTAARWRTRVAKKTTGCCEELDKLYPNVTLELQIHALLTNNSPYCAVCSKPIKLAKNKTCSRQCMAVMGTTEEATTARITKQRQTINERQNNNSSYSSDIINRRKQTMLDRYGALVSPKSRKAMQDRANDLQVKGRATLLERYGITNPGQLTDHHEKCVRTMQQVYGVDHSSKIEQVVEKRKSKVHDKWKNYSSSLSINDIVDYDDPKHEFACKRVVFTCNTCNASDTIPSETFKWRIAQTGTACRECSGLSIGSLLQYEIRNFIMNCGVKIIDNYRLSDGRQIDVYCPDKNIGFEVNGLYWHSEANNIDSKYHLSKTEIAESDSIRLIHIFEDEWEHQQAIVKSRILNLLNLVSKTIDARKCSVREVDSRVEREFLENNHIQGWAPSSIKLGLFYNECLVSLMTFSRPSLSKGIRNASSNHWELLRYCSTLDTVVRGGAGKLLQHFIRTMNPQSIISYSDRRWSIGNLYERLGFSNKGHTRPNYWYVHKHQSKRIHRFRMRKNSNDDTNLTEWQNRANQGYVRIWDCGSTKWLWTNQKKSQ